MKEITVKLYRFDELSESAQHRAYDDSPVFDCAYDSDYIATLKAFERVFDISVYNYRVGDCIFNPSFKYVKVGRADDASYINGNPLRLARYIWNNFADDIRKGKYYSTPGKYIDGKYTYKFRYSKCTFEYDTCPLTGFCADVDILQPVIDCLFYKRLFNSFDELIDECLTGFFRTWDADIEYTNSFEHFAELADCNDWEFLETGERWT